MSSSNSPSPLLTVVTVSFNALDSLLKTMASVQKQTVRARIEYIVIDGASTDGTVEQLQNAERSGQVDVWLSEPDQGIYDAMNKAVGLVHGEYVLFLNAADTFVTENTVERFLDLGTERPGFVWGDCEVERSGQVILDPAPRMLRFLYRQMTVSHQSLAIRTELLRAHPFDLSFKVAADYAVLCALVTEGANGVYRPMTVSRTQDEGFSSRNFFKGLAEKRLLSRRYFASERWRAEPYFWLLGVYMRLKTTLAGLKRTRQTPKGN